MGWQERNKVELRKEFVFRALQPDSNMSALCREFGISRRIGYKWLSRFQEHGANGLEDQSRRPQTSPLETSGELVLRIIELKQTHPRWGPKKILSALKRIPELSDELPSLRTVARVLDRSGLVSSRRRKARPSARPSRAPQLEVERCNQVWTVDFKGWWRTRDQRRCEPLTVRDAHSRFVLAVKVLSNTGTDVVREAFCEIFEEFGIPEVILCDNGSPFSCTRSLAGLTQLSAWWVSLGIKVVRSRPGCPQDNGAHERMHRDMRVELQSQPGVDAAAQQRACDEWRHDFNYVRPHEALNQMCPGEIYSPSSRKFNSEGSTVHDAAPTGCELRTVKANGYIQFRGQLYYATRALSGQSVGIVQRTLTVYDVWFYNQRIGWFDMNKHTAVQQLEEETNEKGGQTAELSSQRSA